jgi:hypothetical protein
MIDERDDRDDRDSPWKEALDRHLEPFMRLLFPEVHAGIDWSKGWEPLDAELQQVVRDAELGRRLADKLYRVWLKDGGELWVLAHIEVQGYVDERLDERVFVYHYRTFDRYQRRVVSLVVLADDRPEWRPGPFRAELLGCEVSLVFPTAKLLDWEPRRAELEADPNPFALVVLAHLASLRTRRDPEGRLNWKWNVTRALYGRGYGREDVLELYRFIDWLLRLPPELAAQFTDRVARLEEEGHVAYVTQIEEQGIARGRVEGRVEGLQQALLAFLEARFGQVPHALATRVRSTTDPALLEQLVQRAALVPALKDFLALLPA